MDGGDAGVQFIKIIIMIYTNLLQKWKLDNILEQRETNSKTERKNPNLR